MTEIADAPAGVLLQPSSSAAGHSPAGSDAARQDIAIKTGDAVQQGAIEGQTNRDADTRPLLKKMSMRFASVRGGKVRFDEGERQTSSP